jgi:hypothetical protein
VWRSAWRWLSTPELVIDALMLVVQWGAERSWNWEQIGTVQLGHAALCAETTA